MQPRRLVLLLVGLLTTVRAGTALDDLIAEETEAKTEPVKKYSSRIRATDVEYGLKTTPRKVLDFRIEPDGLRASAAGAGKGKEDDDDEKTLAQQVADGKYGLIQNELFPEGSKRPGIISYLPNPEVPRDTNADFGGLDKDEIWLAEDHVLVLRGGAYPSHYNDSTPWPPIDDYVAPTRQVEIPKNPKIPPPFPVRLTENGPLELVRGENGSQPPRPPFYPPFPLPPPPGVNNTLLPYPAPPPPFLPPGAAFLPPPGNLTDFDEDDPSIYYPPKYDFFYPQDNTTAVPPGPLVPGIILPPPPDFFAPEKPKDEENETDLDDATSQPPYIAPGYLPTDRKPYKPRTYTKRPPIDKKTTVTYVYPERTRFKTTKSPGFTSPIYVPNKQEYVPTTSPRPNHITIPRNKTLKQDIYIISTEPPEVANNIIDLIREKKPTKTTTLEGISPDRHPLRSLIRPDVSVSYIGKYGHLPPSTAFPFPKTEPPTTEPYKPATGHFITLPPSVTVTPVPMVNKIRVKPTDSATKSPHATFFFYEEPTTATPNEENEVSPSPISQYVKDDPDYNIKPIKLKTRPRPKPQEDPGNFNAQIENSGLFGLYPVTEPPQHFQNPTTEQPFIPSNYYATANPDSIHFTPLDPNIVDDMTMKYFTIFGQKLNAAGGTTPLTPAPPTSTPRPIFQSTEPPKYRPTHPPQSYVQVTTPKSHFEQYLKEITGEDQQDYVVTHHGSAAPKIKKPKARPGFSPRPNLHQYYLPYRPAGISQYIENIYRPTHSTTLRPVTDVDIQPQYLPPQLSTTLRPYVPQRSPKPLSHNFGQYLQEVTYTRPRGPNPASNLQYFDSSAHSTASQQRPVSLEGDTLVNYRPPMPPVNPDAELLPTSYTSQSNIKIVQAPNLTRNRQQQQQPYRPLYRQPPQKPFFENYFGPPQPNTGNAFVSYNLPGNGGHFYFLTPQALDRSDDQEHFRTVKRSDQSVADRLSHRPTSDYLRRRRKKA